MMVEAHYHYHQRWYKKIDTVELVSIITTHQVSNKKAKTSSPPYNELRGRELILKLINNIRGGYLFSQGRGSGGGAPEKNFAFPPRFLGGKGFSDCFLGKIDTSRTQFLRHIKSIIQVLSQNKKYFASPPLDFLGGKGFQTVFLGKIDTSRTQFLRYIKSIIQVLIDIYNYDTIKLIFQKFSKYRYMQWW